MNGFLIFRASFYGLGTSTQNLGCQPPALTLPPCCLPPIFSKCSKYNGKIEPDPRSRDKRFEIQQMEYQPSTVRTCHFHQLRVFMFRQRVSIFCRKLSYFYDDKCKGDIPFKNISRTDFSLNYVYFSYAGPM